MDRLIRRRMEMAVHARDFSRAHPSADASHASVLERLEGTILRMEGLAEQQVTGLLAKRSSTVRRKDVKARLRDGILRHLVTVAEDAAREKPELGDKFRLPYGSATNKAFQVTAKAMLDQGVAEKELLAKHGLGEKLLDDLRQAIDEFDASVTESVEAKRRHVLARAELEMLGEEVMQLVGMLDGINRYRFARDPQLLVAWNVAKHVVAGPQVAGEPAAEPGEAAGTASTPEAPGGEVKPAA